MRTTTVPLVPMRDNSAVSETLEASSGLCIKRRGGQPGLGIRYHRGEARYPFR